MEDLRVRLLAWRPALDESAVERELARAIYVREPGTENRFCPPEWTEAFEAADQLREPYAAVPEEVLTRWLIELHRAEGGRGRARNRGRGRRLQDNHRAPVEDHRPRRGRDPGRGTAAATRQTLAGFYYGERGYEVQKRIDRLMEERSLDA